MELVSSPDRHQFMMGETERMCESESLPGGTGGTGLCSADHRAVQDVMDLFRVFSLYCDSTVS
jgi:hypothetical protein